MLKNVFTTKMVLLSKYLKVFMIVFHANSCAKNYALCYCENSKLWRIQIFQFDDSPWD